MLKIAIKTIAGASPTALPKEFVAASMAMFVCGVCMAQSVTLSGTLAVDFKETTRGDVLATKQSGLGLEQSALDLKLSYQIDSMQTFDAALGLAGVNRIDQNTLRPADTNSGSVYGRDVSISYTNKSFGRIKIAATEGADFFNEVAGLGLSGDGQPLIEMDGKLHEIKTATDSISFATKLGAVYVQASRAESGTNLGVGVGDQSRTVDGQRRNTYSLYYNEGPLILLAAYRTYDNQKSGPCTFTDCPAIFVTKDNISNAQASYDFGVAKIGLGYQLALATNGAKQTDTMVAAAVPIGPLTLAAAYSTSQTSFTPDTSAFGSLPLLGLVGGLWPAKPYEGTQNGTSLGLKYALDKKTHVLVRYAFWTHSGYSRYEWDARYKKALLDAYGRAVAILAQNPSSPAAAGAVIRAFNDARDIKNLSGLTADNIANEASLVLTYSF